MNSILRYLFISIVIICFLTNISAQKSDYVWLSGYDAYPHPVFDTIDSVYWATTIMDFNYSPLGLSPDSLQMNFDRTNVSFCDSDGKLLFYSNGIYIANALDESIENSDSLNAGWLQYVWGPSIQIEGYRNTQGMLAIPDASIPSHYYLIHTLTDSIPNDDEYLFCPKVSATYLDMPANDGLGEVIYKNREIIADTVDGFGEEITAARHGNGKDWWIVAQKRNSNCYDRILLDDTGLHVLSDSNCGGAIIAREDIGAACFSPDGSKYVYYGSLTGVNIFDFDRCSGILTNPHYLPLPISVDSGWLGIGLAISPNNRFLYISLTEQLYQIDLLDSNPFINIDTVGFYDGFYLKPYQFIRTYFDGMQLGPDGKIYIGCGNSAPYYHVINNPDFKGDSCNFQQHSLRLFAPSWGVPNFPNYRLGALVGSVCDTLTGLSEVVRAAKEAILKVYPNPAATNVTIDYGFTDWSKSGEVKLEIANELGQVVFSQKLPAYSGFQQLDVTKYATGIYMAFIKRNEQVIAVQKFAKE